MLELPPTIAPTPAPAAVPTPAPVAVREGATPEEQPDRLKVVATANEVTTTTKRRERQKADCEEDMGKMTKGSLR
jgi:hypothetical protein